MDPAVAFHSFECARSRRVDRRSSTRARAADALGALADHFAYNAEGDRWIGGEGCREYRP